MSDKSEMEKSLIKGRDGSVSIALAFGTLSMLLGREAIPPLLPSIIDSLSLTELEAGISLSVMWLLYALSQFPGGRLSDNLTRKTVLVSSNILVIFGFAITYIANFFVAFVISLGIVGIGAGAFYTSTRGWLSDTFPNRRAEAFGIQISAGSIGSALASSLAVIAMNVGTWQLAFLPPIFSLLVVAIALHILTKEKYVIRRTSLGIIPTLKRILSHSRILQVLVIYSLFAFVWQGLIAFLPTFLQFQKDLSPALASAAFASLYVTGMLMGPIAGAAGDRFGHLQISSFSLLLGITGLGGLLLSLRTPFVLLSVVILAIGVRSYPPVMQAFIFSIFPDDSIAGDFGALKMVYTGIGSLGPLYVGIVAQQFTYTYAFFGYFCILLIAMFSIVLLLIRARG